MDKKQYKQILTERIFVFDGAMGTNLQHHNPTIDDYQGKDGCPEVLNFSRPEWIKDVHAQFFKAGCDAVETNTFGANRLVLSEFGLEDQVIKYNKTAVKLAKEVAKQFSTPDKPRFVAGSIGPGTKLPSLGHTTFDILRQSFGEQVEGLLQGGVDLILIETCQDLLQVKAAINGALDAQRKLKIQVPLNVQVTVESTGTLLLGSDMATAINVIECFPVDTIGLNCATGPAEMSEHVRTLGEMTNRFISVLPNAGLPENVGGKAVYRLTPDELAGYLVDFVKRFGVNVVGGCCGTTPAHLKAVADAVKNLKPKRRSPQKTAMASSLYMSVPFRQEPAPLIVGERTNANGSKVFRDHLNADDYDGLIPIAKEQEADGVHMLDVCTAYVGRDENKDMQETIKRFTLQSKVPLMIDSTETSVTETALKLIGGKAVINSINLEDGEKKANAILPLLKTYGAAVVALTIDEEGMAKGAAKKLEIAKRIHKLTTEKFSIPGSDLIFDALTFTLGSGDEELRKAGLETLEGIRQIKKTFPEVHTLLGVSNISFGLAPDVRSVLNSVFLHHAVEAGLDMAIVNFKKILPLHLIDAKGRELARQLLFDERKFAEDGTLTYDPLKELMAHYEKVKTKAVTAKPKKPKTVEEDLKQRIIDGNQKDIDKTLDEALKKYPALEIINSILLAGMKVVGDMFGAGEIQLPFVLQSAATMKAAVRILEPHIPKQEGGKTKGKIVLATVKGDVHDIGKNLVDIILSNNGYTVINIGIKQTIDEILKAAQEHKPDAIGLSGLLVKSTVVMKENLEEMNRRNLPYNVVLGGAALTKRFVEADLRNLYNGKVFYAGDAFDGLRIMDELTDLIPEKKLTKGYDKTTSGPAPTQAKTPIKSTAPAVIKSPSAIKPVKTIPTPPFWGTRTIQWLNLKEIFPYINEIALLKVRWGFKRTRSTTMRQYNKLFKQKVYPLFEKWKRTAIREGILRPKVAYGYFPCQSDGNSVVVYEEDLKTERFRYDFPRQKVEPWLCLADYYASVKSGQMDVMPMMVVTIGSRATEQIQKKFRKDAYDDYFFLHGLSVETAEALAEFWHKRIREELKINKKDARRTPDLLRKKYQGARYSFGYPACPNLEDQTKLFALLNASKIGVRLSEELQMVPEQSVSAIITHHPQAKYFSVVA